MESEEYKKLKKAVLKLKSDNDSLKEELEELKQKAALREKGKSNEKKDELDDWFGEGEGEGEGENL